MIVRTAAQRVSWGFADQALSSLSNFAVGILVARSVSTDAFGAFGVAFVTYTVALVTSRALVGEPFMVRHSATSQDAWHAATRGSSTMAIATGVTAGLVVALLGIILRGDFGVALLAVSVCLPGLLLQDMWRYAFIAQGRSERAFLLDLVWVVVMVPGLLVLDATGVSSLAWPILIWGGAGGIAAVMAQVATRSVPTRALGASWWRDHRDLGPRYVAEALVSVGAIQASMYALVAFGGLSAAGALRGGQLLLGPMQVLFMGIGITAIPEGVRLMQRGGREALRRPAVVVSLVMAGATLVWGALMNALPDSIGVALLGDTWSAAREVVTPLALAYAILCLSLGAGIGLRVLADSRRSLRARTVDAASQATGGVLGAWLGGAVGTALGLAVGSLIGATTHWILFHASMRGPGRSASTPPDGTVVVADDPARLA